MRTQIPLSALFVTMFNFKTRLTNRLIAAGPVWWCLSQVRCNHNARYSHSLTGRATQNTVEWNLSVSVCSHHALCTQWNLCQSMQLSTHWAQWNPCQSAQSPCFPHTGHNGTSVCVVTMLSTHRAQATVEPQSVQSPCFPHTGHNGTSVCAVTMLSTHRAQWNLCLCSHHAFHTPGTMEPQSV